MFLIKAWNNLSKYVTWSWQMPTIPCDIGLMQNSTGIVAGNTVCICNCVFVFSGTQKIESLKWVTVINFGFYPLSTWHGFSLSKFSEKCSMSLQLLWLHSKHFWTTSVNFDAENFLQFVGYNALNQWFPTFFDAFLPLLIFTLFIPPPWHKTFFIPPLLHESAGIFDFPIYSFSPAFYLSRCSFEFVG